MAKKEDLDPKKIATQRRSVETVDAILQATEEFIEHDKLDSLTTNKIADRAGVNISSLYQYFPNKNSVLQMVLKVFINQEAKFFTNVLHSVADCSPEEKIDKFIDFTYKHNLKRKKIVKLFASTIFDFQNTSLIEKFDLIFIDILKSNVFPHVKHPDLDVKLLLVIQMVRYSIVSSIFYQEIKFDHSIIQRELKIAILSYLEPQLN